MHNKRGTQSPGSQVATLKQMVTESCEKCHCEAPPADIGTQEGHKPDQNQYEVVTPCFQSGYEKCKGTYAQVRGQGEYYDQKRKTNLRSFRAGAASGTGNLTAALGISGPLSCSHL